MAFLALGKKTGSFFQYPFAGARAILRSCSLNRENTGRAIETKRDNRNNFFENETIFVLITPRSWVNLALKKKIHNARSVANQSARIIVAI